MGKREKLLAKVERTKRAKWKTLVRLMEFYGFSLEDDTGSSHCSFFHEGTGVRQFVVKPHPQNEVHPRMKRDCLRAIRLTLGETGSKY